MIKVVEANVVPDFHLFNENDLRHLWVTKLPIFHFFKFSVRQPFSRNIFMFVQIDIFHFNICW